MHNGMQGRYKDMTDTCLPRRARCLQTVIDWHVDTHSLLFSSLPAPVPLYLLRLALKLQVTVSDTDL